MNTSKTLTSALAGTAAVSAIRETIKHIYPAVARMNLSGKQTLSAGAVMGLVAGLGSVVAPTFLGLKEEHSNRTLQSKAMIVGLSIIGGMVTASVLHFMTRGETLETEGTRSGFDGNQVIGYDEQ